MQPNPSGSQSSENGGDLGIVFGARKANTCTEWKVAAKVQQTHIKGDVTTKRHIKAQTRAESKI